MKIRSSLTGTAKSNWLWAGFGVLLGAIALLALILLGYFTRQAQTVTSPATPILVFITAPTASVTIPPPTQIVEPSYTPTSTLPPEAEGSLWQGRLVEVYGTAGDGLRLRENSGLDAKIVSLAVESEVFELRTGPVEKDGYDWWFLVNPYNLEETGWAVSTYLRAID